MEYFYPSFYLKLFDVVKDNKETVNSVKAFSCSVLFSAFVLGLIKLITTEYYHKELDEETYAAFIFHVVAVAVVVGYAIAMIAKIIPHAIKIRQEMRCVTKSTNHLKRLLHSVTLPVQDGEDGTFIELRVYSDSQGSSENPIQPFDATEASNSMDQPDIELPSEPGPPAYKAALSHALRVAISYKNETDNYRNRLREMEKRLEEDRKRADLMAKEFIAQHGRALRSIQPDHTMNLFNETSL